MYDWTKENKFHFNKKLKINECHLPLQELFFFIIFVSSHFKVEISNYKTERRKKFD
jgi:hypothetical protein